MGKLDIKKLYESALIEKDEEKEDGSEKKEGSEKKSSEKVKNPKDKIVAGLEGMKPGAVLQTIAKQLDTTSSKFLGKHLIQIIVNAAKNGKVKFDAIKSQIKDFDKKNIEDNSKIDWDNVELDPAGTSMKCLFDGDSKKIIDEFMEKYESEMKDVKSEIEEADKKLHDDVKKAKVKIDDDKLDENGLVVASVIDDKKNKGKSGKELTKQVDAAIEQKEEVEEIKTQAKEADKKLDEISIDSNVSKMSDDDLSKALAATDEKAKAETSDVDSLVKDLDEKLTSKIGKDYKSSLLTGIYDKDEIKKYANKNKLKIDFSAIKASQVLGVRVDFFTDESSDVISEVVDDKAGYKTRKVDSAEKDKGIKKIYSTFVDTIKNVFDKNMLDGDPVSYLKYWNGKNDDGNFDSLFVFVGVKEDANESINENNTNASIGFAVLPNGSKVPCFSYQTMSRQISALDDIFDDGKIDANEMKKLKRMGSCLNAYLDWAEQNKGNESPVVQQKIAAIKRLNSKYRTLLDNNPVGYTTDGSGRVLDIEDPKQAKAVAAASASDDAKKAAGGWKEKLGLNKAFTALGIARLVAKTTGVVLNNGKALVDMAGKQAMKYKEDKNIIAELKCILTNGKDSKSKFEDTKFSVRFDVGDCKWHATCLDNRKMKFPDDKLLKIVFDSEHGKKFKQYCLNRWSAIFSPKDKTKAIIPFIIKNAESIGMKNTKMSKEFVTTVQMMSDKFDKISAEMK